MSQEITRFRVAYAFMFKCKDMISSGCQTTMISKCQPVTQDKHAFSIFLARL